MMRSEHLSPQHIDGYRRRVLAPHELLAADDHLATCAACRRELGQPEQLQALFSSFRGLSSDAAMPEHVSAAQLAAYVSGAADDLDREIIESHLELCDACAEEDRDLRAFKARTAVDHDSASTRAWLPMLWSRQGAFALASLALVLIVVWEGARYRRLERQLDEMSTALDQLKSQNDSLRAAADALTRENQSLTAARSSEGVALQDTSGPAAVGPTGSVRLAAHGTLPPTVAKLVAELVSAGTVTRVDAVQPAFAALAAERTRGALSLRPDVARRTPVPVSPVLTAIRSLQPTLQWKAVPSGRIYKVVVADRDNNIVWQSSVATTTRVTLPPGVLHSGQVYFWQVEAVGDGTSSSLSPTVGFVVLEEQMQRDVEALERPYQASAVVLAGLYTSYGLYEDALTQVERLRQLNPNSPQVLAMRDRIQRELGQQ